MQDFRYTFSFLNTLEVALSPERLQQYRAAAQGNSEQAMRLYVWNTALGEALYSPIQTLEIVLRNSLHQQLQAEYGEDWFCSSQLPLRQNLKQLLEHAQHQLHRQRQRISPGGIVAELSFGFWTGLLGSHYEHPLWRYCLHRAFPAAPRPLLRKDIHRKLVTIRRLRNRIAHHEPIFAASLPAIHHDILQLIAGIYPAVADWVEYHSRFEQIWLAKPMLPALEQGC